MKELLSKIPLPEVDKLTAVARSLQVTGIAICLLDGRKLTRCQCFRDLALAESSERMKQIFRTALIDFSNLARFGSPSPTPTIIAMNADR
ncbi:hypothetical protein SAMN04489717_0988 [Actinopolymorpha singaporensis]|uniref:Uncharacterized protein n=1 Tax=Actinopolymorpha singaporensis TaxID=117157 RepID=A0A1H1MWP3_9ACTN|nr:hypothetical protein SAMN04489717_0988 [Actinopolymorpha singaporensis]